MGYYTSYSGDALIKPDLPESDIPAEWGENGDGYFYIAVHLGEQTVGVKPDGTLGVIGEPGWMTVEFRWDESGKYYDFDSACHQLQEWVTEHGATITGYFEGQGEEGERFRYRFEGGHVHYDLPKIVWPGDPGYDKV